MIYINARAQFSDDMIDQLTGKRNKVVEARIVDVIGKAFDPQDPVQRRILDRMVPSFTKSKKEIVQMALEQRTFLIGCMLDASVVGEGGEEASYEKMTRIIRLLGGAERLISHPLLEASMGVVGKPALIGRNYALGALFKNNWDFNGGLRGLFSYGTSDRNGTVDYLSQTANQRNELAIYLIHLFPAFREGLLPAMDDMAAGVNRQKTGRAARQLVLLCEAAVKDDVSVSSLLSDDGVVPDNSNYVKQGWGGSILRPSS